MKINEDKLKRIIREEVDEGLGDIARSAGAGVKRLKSKATTAVKKALVDPFKLAKTEEDFLNVMKNMIPDSGDEGKSDEKWLKQWNFLKNQYLNSPTAKARWKKSWDPLGHATEEAEILASAAMEEPIIDPALEENKTKLTKSQLKQIIKEELVNVLLEDPKSQEEAVKEVEEIESQISDSEFGQAMRDPLIKDAVEYAVKELEQQLTEGADDPPVTAFTPGVPSTPGQLAALSTVITPSILMSAQIIAQNPEIKQAAMGGAIGAFASLGGSLALGAGVGVLAALILKAFKKKKQSVGRDLSGELDPRHNPARGRYYSKGKKVRPEVIPE